MARALTKTVTTAGRATRLRAVLVHPGARSSRVSDRRTSFAAGYAAGAQLVVLRVAGGEIYVRSITHTLVPQLGPARIRSHLVQRAKDSPGTLAVPRATTGEAVLEALAVRRLLLGTGPACASARDSVVELARVTAIEPYKRARKKDDEQACMSDVPRSFSWCACVDKVVN